MTEEPPRIAEPSDRIALKATLLLVLTLALLVGFLVYVLYARGTFEETQRLVLMTDNAEGVSVGSDLSFSGFPVGRVQRIELARTGQARIEIDVPRSQAQWLRSSSMFTLERGLVGGARLRAFTTDMSAPPLPDGAVREVLRGDTTDELPALVAGVKRLVENLERMTAYDSDINRSLEGLRTLADRAGGRYGLLTALLGSEDDAQKVVGAIDRLDRVLASLESAARRIDGLSGKAEETLTRADQRLLGKGGVTDEVQTLVHELSAMLADARESLKKVDAVLVDAQGIAADTRAATADLQALRAEVETSLRKASQLIDEINRKWPFRRDAELSLP
ncbi:MlaD family protein [Burkholderiaceae bacterium FT117]|uniref:MlaD family protein n=1 Tax=Zeimonas sediminis TaxID=2944268 RepID=UPI002343125E|nr:MlaD family protein [Zeimonas sediminis]MCM5569449.1 MlaD family protein [Zeimonas sediminis]